MFKCQTNIFDSCFQTAVQIFEESAPLFYASQNQSSLLLCMSFCGLIVSDSEDVGHGPTGPHNDHNERGYCVPVLFIKNEFIFHWLLYILDTYAK